VVKATVERYVALAERFREELYGPDTARWMDRVDRELDDIRQILGHLAAGQRQADIDQALRIAGGLREYWWKRDRLQEGRAWLLRLLALPQASPPTALRAQALDDAAVLAFYQGDHEDAIALLQESIAIRRDLGERESIVYSLLHLASIYRVGKRDIAAARAANEEALSVARQHDFEQGIGYALSALGRVAIEEADWPAARTHLDASLRVLQQLDDTWALAIVVLHCALLAAATNALRRALRLAAASTAVQERLGMTAVAADQELADAILGEARATLPPAEADAAWQEGAAMPLERAVEYALQHDPAT
jgi:tetratricopeptide (TPR) repeat protein